MFTIAQAERGPRIPISNPAEEIAATWGLLYEQAFDTEIDRLRAMSAEKFVSEYVADPVEALETLFGLLRTLDLIGAHAYVDSMMSRVATKFAEDHADRHASEGAG